MNIVWFTHSLRSCWNHGNAHFLRGVLRELRTRGHRVTVWEPEGGWSLRNLLADHGEAGLDAFHAAYPELDSHIYGTRFDAAAACDAADLVVVHEWSDPALVAAIGRARRHARFTLLFHDTHHRAVSDPAAIRAFDLSGYDGVLAFGAALAEVYRAQGWGSAAHVWHEAADTTVFFPHAAPDGEQPTSLVWIGNWGDGERSAELEEFLLRPAREAGLPLDIHGVRYPAEAMALLSRYGARHRGWLPNAAAPARFARHLATVHVPRRFYASILPGIPTIRVFEALACGIPLVSAPWQDSEHLFGDGDFLRARNGDEMRRHLTALRDDADLRAQLTRNGLHTIRARHTCAHRVDELLGIVATLRQPVAEAV